MLGQRVLEPSNSEVLEWGKWLKHYWGQCLSRTRILVYLSSLSLLVSIIRWNNYTKNRK